MRPSERRGDSIRRTGRAVRSSGFSVIELMVGVAIGLVIVAAVLQSFAASSANASLSSFVSEYQTNGRYALEILKREIRHAALHPMVWDAGQVGISTNAAARDYGCGAGVSTNLMQGIVASSEGSLFPSTCFSSARTDRQYLRGDMLMLRRTAREAVPTASFLSGAPYVRLGYGTGNVFVGVIDSPSAAIAAPFYNYPLVSDIYFINSFTNSATESPRVPALYRLTLSAGANPIMVPELIASNVEHLQVQFGQVIDPLAGTLQYFNAGGVTDWSAITSVRIWLLLRATQPEPGLASASYVMGDLTYTPGDNYRRTVLSSTIDLRNQ